MHAPMDITYSGDADIDFVRSKQKRPTRCGWGELGVRGKVGTGQTAMRSAPGIGSRST